MRMWTGRRRLRREIGRGRERAKGIERWFAVEFQVIANTRRYFMIGGQTSNRLKQCGLFPNSTEERKKIDSKQKDGRTSLCSDREQ